MMLNHILEFTHSVYGNQEKKKQTDIDKEFEDDKDKDHRYFLNLKKDLTGKLPVRVDIHTIGCY